MNMGSRIFIGNLSTNIEEKHLKKKFSQYGDITNLEIKQKLDFEGKPLSQFAYLNLDSSSSRIRECISALDGSNLKGSCLKVQLAKESFLERLKREREQKNKPSNNANDLTTAHHVGNFSNRESHLRDSKENDSFYRNDWYGSENKPSYDKNEAHSYNNRNSQSWRSYDNDSSNRNWKSEGDSRNHTHRRKKSEGSINDNAQALSKPHTKNYTNFERFDPSVEENDFSEENKEFRSRNGHSKSTKEDLDDSRVDVASDIQFNRNASEFSLLKKFSEIKSDEYNVERKHKKCFIVQSKEFDESTCQGERIVEKKSLRTFSLPPVVKKTRNFFIESCDPFLEAGVEWLTTPLTEENKAEFEAMRKDLLGACSMRRVRAMKKSKSLTTSEKIEKPKEKKQTSFKRTSLKGNLRKPKLKRK